MATAMMPRARVGWLLLAAAQIAAADPVPEVAIDHGNDAQRRGAALVTSVCLSCHGLKYLHYRDLLKLGLAPAEVEAMGMGAKLNDALDAMTPPDIAEQTYGRVPPDLSLMAKAREGGPAYIYGLLTEFYENEEGRTDNRLYPGIRMPDILGWSGADAAQRTALAQQAKDIAAFLSWAADPRAEERERLGYYVIGYLALLTALLYLVKRKVWARLR